MSDYEKRQQEENRKAAQNAFNNMGVSNYAMSEVGKLLREPTQIITFVYKNWKGETRERKVVPINIEFGSDHYHQPAQWLLHAIDMEKGARRTFAFNHMLTAPRMMNNV